MVSQSDWLPMAIPTTGFPEIFLAVFNGLRGMFDLLL
jgi:hypothetical protein